MSMETKETTFALTWSFVQTLLTTSFYIYDKEPWTPAVILLGENANFVKRMMTQPR